MAHTHGESKNATRRTRGDGGLYQDAKGLWVGIVWLTDENGKRKQKRVASKSKAVAAQKLNTLRSDVISGRVTIKPANITTVGEWLDYWLESIRSDNVKPGTARSYEGTIRLYLQPHIGDVKLHKLTAAQVRGVYKKLQDGTAVSKPSTRNAQKAHQVLKMALTQAVKDRAIQYNPCSAVDNPQHVKKARGAFELDAARHILMVAAKQDDESVDKPKLASRWAAAFMTGARKSELLGLEWDRVDLDAGSMDISWQLQRHQKVHGCELKDGKPSCKRVRPAYCPDAKWKLPPGFEWEKCYKSLLWTRPKSTSGIRRVPIHPMLLAALKVHRSMDTGENPHGLVWHHLDGRPVSPEEDSAAWNDLMAAAGIEKTAGVAVLHEARNTAATMLLEAGVDVRVIQEILGHATILQTRDYQRVSLPLAQEAVSGAFGKLLSQ